MKIHKGCFVSSLKFQDSRKVWFIIMKIHEKILYCRKKEGLSQEALAEKLGVSRQAISKWETGDAVPEISKLLLIANTFGVSTDWLLSEDDEEHDKDKEVERSSETNNFTSQPYHEGSNWVDSVPGLIGSLIRRFGWLIGVYIALIGTGFIGIGALARYMVRRMFSNSISNFFGGMISGDTLLQIQHEINTEGAFKGFSNQLNRISSFGLYNPVYTMGMFLMIVGLIMLVGGIIVAIILKKNSNRKI